MSELKALADSDRAQDEAVKRGLAWAFTCLDDTQGFISFFMNYLRPLSRWERKSPIYTFLLNWTGSSFRFA